MMPFARTNPSRRPLTLTLSLSLSLLASLIACAAQAQEQPQEQTQQLNLDNTVITATQTAHSTLSAPASVSVITREELDKLPVYNLADAVKTLPGVHINTSAGYGRKEIKIRGMDSDYTLLLLNGRRINSRDALTSNYANDFDLSSIPMSAIERIEVIRGPMSSLYGADALGGVVNVILRQPGNRPEAGVAYNYETPTEGDNGDSHKTSAYVSGALVEDRLFGNLIVEHVDQAAWQSEQLTLRGTDAAEQRQAVSAFGSLSWLLDERQSIDLDFSHREDDRKARWNNAGAPAPLTTNVQGMERSSFGIAHNGSWDAFDSRLRYYFEDVELTDDSQLMTTLRRRVGEVEQRNHTLDGQVSGDLGSHLLTAGTELRRSELEHNQNLGNRTNVDQQAVYLQDQFALGDLAITLGGRWDHHETFGAEFSPRAYGVYTFNDNWVIKGGVGKAFKAPSMPQADPDYGVLACRGMCTVIGNAELKPETSISKEFGTLYQDQRLEAGIMFFHNAIEDMIVSDSWRPAEGYRPPVMTYTNVSQARVQGYEVHGRYALSEALGLRANYTYSDAEDRDTQRPLNNTPEHLANLGLDWQLQPNLGLTLDYQYTGSQWLYLPGASGGNQETGAYHTVNLGAKLQANDHLTFTAGLNNLTNSRRDDVAQAVDHILMERSAFVGISYDL